MNAEPLKFLDPSKVRIWMPENAAHPRAEIEGDRCLPEARIRCAFPLSKPNEFFSLQDGAGKEVGLLSSLEGMDADSLAVVRGVLDRVYFTPKIASIEDLRQDAGMWKFSVKTQRGDTEFYVRNWRDSSHEIQLKRWVISSVDGLRFEIPDIEALDAKSQLLLERLF